MDPAGLPRGFSGPAGELRKVPVETLPLPGLSEAEPVFEARPHAGETPASYSTEGLAARRRGSEMFVKAALRETVDILPSVPLTTSMKEVADFLDANLHVCELGREYRHVVFDKRRLTDDPTLEWVTPWHPLFEAVCEDVFSRVQGDLRRGAVFYTVVLSPFLGRV